MQHIYNECIANDVILLQYWSELNPPGKTPDGDDRASGVGVRYSQVTSRTVGGVTYAGTNRKADVDPGDCRRKGIAWQIDQTTTRKSPVAVP
jgi:hypothetical protein